MTKVKFRVDGLSREKSVWLVGLMLALLLPVIVRLPWFGGPFSRDEASAMTVAAELTHGNLPHETAWQQRQPFTYLFYGAAAILPAGPDTELDILSTFLASGATLGIFLAVWPLFPPFIAIAGTVTYALLSADCSMQGQTANTELIINALLVCSMLFTLAFLRGGRPWALFAAGGLVGIASGVKEIGALFLTVLLAGVIMSQGPRLRSIAAVMTSFLLPWLLLLIVYYARGHLSIFVDTFLFNSRHGTLLTREWLAPPVLLMKTASAFWGSWPLWVVALAVAFSRPWINRLHVLGVVYFVAALVMIMLPGRYFAHYYYLALPPLIILACCFVEERRQRGMPRGRSLRLGILAVICFLAAIQASFAARHIPLSIRENWPTAAPERQHASIRDLAFRLRAGLPGTSTLLLYGIDNELYFYTQWRPAEPILWLSYYDQTYFRRATPVMNRFIDRVESALTKKVPDVVILEERLDASPSGAPIERFVARLLNEHFVPLRPENIGLSSASPSEVWGFGVEGVYVRGAANATNRRQNPSAEAPR